MANNEIRVRISAEAQQFISGVQSAINALHQFANQVNSSGVQISSANTQISSLGSQAQAAGTQIQAAGTQIHNVGSQAQATGTQAQAAGAQMQGAGSQAQVAGAQFQAAGTQIHHTGSTFQVAGAQIHAAGAQIQATGAQIHAAGAQITSIGTQINNISVQTRSLPAPTTLTNGFTSAGVAIGSVYMGIMAVKGAIESLLMPFIKYKSTLEQNQVAFETFLGSTELAKKYLGDLQKIAADTPFDLPGVTEAGKKLLAFGFGAKQSLSMLKTIGDTAAGTGKGKEGIDRITLALGQIKAKGRIMGDELMQLTDAGIPAYTILAQKLGLTAKQVGDIGNAGISADVGIKALLEGMDEKFGDLSEKVSTTTLGMLNAIKDNFLTIGAALIEPLYEALGEGLAAVKKWSTQVADAIRNGDGKAAISQMFESMIPRDLMTDIKSIAADFKELKNTWAGIWEGGGSVGGELLAGIAKGVVDTVRDVMKLLDFVGEIGNTLMWIVNQLLPEGSAQFKSLKDFIAFCVKALLEFFIIRKIVALTEGLIGLFKILGGGIRTGAVAVRDLIRWIGTMATNIRNGFSSGQSAATVFKNVITEIGKQLKDLVKKPWKIALLFSAGTSLTDEKSAPEEQKTENGDEPKEPEYEEPKPTDLPADNSKYYQAQKKALDQTTQAIKQYYAKKLMELEAQLKNATENYDPKGNIEEQARILEQIKFNISEAKFAETNEIYNAIKNTAFEDAKEKELKLGDVQLELDKLAIELGDVSKTLARIGDIAATQAQAGADAVKAAESLLGVGYGTGTGQLVCSQYVKAAWEKAGIGLAKEFSDWVPTMVDQAKKNGLWKDAASGYQPKAGDAVVIVTSKEAGNEKYGHIGLADGKGGMYDSSYSKQKAVYRSSIEGTFGNDVGGYIVMPGSGAGQSKKIISNLKKYQEDFKKLMDDGAKITAELASAMGDISTHSKRQIETEYNGKIKAFKENGLDAFAANAEKAKALKLSQIDFKQNEKNIETAYDDAARKQKEALKTVGNDTAGALNTASQAAAEYLAVIKDEREKLESALKSARENGFKDLAKEIADKLEKISDKIKDFYVVALEKLETELDRKLALIESNPNLTDMQKRDLSKDVRRKKLQGDLSVWKDERRVAVLNEDNKRASQVDFEIAKLQNQLGSLGTMLDDVRQASKQAFEDGLLDFLSRGIIECESLKDAFKELAITVLQSIQKIFAEDMTKNIMIGLGFGKEYEKEKQALNGTGLQGQFSAITANTNQFLMSFEGQMFTFNSKSMAAFQNIIQTIQNASAAIPTTTSSLGGLGSLGSSGGGSGSSFSFDSNWFGTLKAFADGGSTSQGDNGGLVKGAGTGTSDSILSYIGKKMVRIANGEYVVKAATVKKLGTRFLDKVNSGEIYNLDIPIPRYAQGGAVGTAGSSAAAKGMELFSQELGCNVSPKINVNNYVDGQRIFDQYGKPLVRSEARKEIMENLKMYTMLGKRF